MLRIVQSNYPFLKIVQNLLMKLENHTELEYLVYKNLPNLPNFTPFMSKKFFWSDFDSFICTSL